MAEYINRQALLRFLNDIWLTATPNDFMPDDDRHLAMARCMGLNDAMDAVKSIPTADVVPVVHGHWIKSPECPEEYDICSACGRNDKHRSRRNWEHDMVESVPPFCKWCGARMDLVTDRNQVKDGDGE